MELFWLEISEFAVDGNKIKLYNFSIINGCQTTTLIGEYSGVNEGDDFYLPCKIVKSNKNKIDDEFYSTISKIAEASNSQKPISDRDLKSNRDELKNLKRLLLKEEPKVHLIIKRGEEIKKKSFQYIWQTIHNDFLGQLILSFNLALQERHEAGRKIYLPMTVYMIKSLKENTIWTILKIF